MLVFVIWNSFEKFKSDWNQTWVKDAIGFLSMLMGVKLRGKLKIAYFFTSLKVEVQLQPDLD